MCGGCAPGPNNVCKVSKRNLRGHDFLRGRISRFSTDFCMDLRQLFLLQFVNIAFTESSRVQQQTTSETTTRSSFDVNGEGTFFRHQ